MNTLIYKTGKPMVRVRATRSNLIYTENNRFFHVADMTEKALFYLNDEIKRLKGGTA